jgi:hypothetical protein
MLAGIPSRHLVAMTTPGSGIMLSPKCRHHQLTFWFLILYANWTPTYRAAPGGS